MSEQCGIQWYLKVSYYLFKNVIWMSKSESENMY